MAFQEKRTASVKIYEIVGLEKTKQMDTSTVEFDTILAIKRSIILVFFRTIGLSKR